MLLDSASLYFRAYYGVPDTLRGPDGRPNNALRGFLDMIARLMDSYRPTGLVAALDYDWRPEFRVVAIPSYKAHRVADDGDGEEAPDDLEAQVPSIIATLDALGLCSVGVAGYEADDVIGTLAGDIPGPIDVVTGDRDLFQLVDDAKGVRIVYTARGMSNLEIVDDTALHAKYGVRAEQYVDFATLRGDASDGLPGVKGIGEKTAATLLAHYGNLAAIRGAAADDVDGGPMRPAARRNLVAASDYLDAAPEVVAVRRDLHLTVHPAIPAAPADPSALEQLAADLGIATAVKRVTDAMARLRDA